MKSRQSSIRRGPVTFKVHQHVRISKEKLKFAKGGEQNYTTEIFTIQRVVSRIPRPVYELVDLLGNHIAGQFYEQELTPVLLYCVRGFKTGVLNILSAGLVILQI
jgi:hypothetical protein